MELVRALAILLLVADIVLCQMPLGDPEEIPQFRIGTFRGGWGGWSGGWSGWDNWLPGGKAYKKGLKRSKKRWKRRNNHWYFHKDQRPYLNSLHGYPVHGPYGWGWNGWGSDWDGEDYWKGQSKGR